MSQNNDFDTFNSDPSKYPYRRNRLLRLWAIIFVIFVLCSGGALTLEYWPAQISTQDPNVIATPNPSYIIYDFEDYNSEQSLEGQNGWDATGLCEIEVVSHDGNQFVRSGSCGRGQSAMRPQYFGSVEEFPRVSVYFRGRITRGGTGTGTSFVALTTNYVQDDEIIYFGMGSEYSQTDKTTTYPLYLGSNQTVSRGGQSLKPDQWYEFRLDIDWSYNGDQGYGQGTIFYRPWGTTNWLTDSELTDIEFGISDPSRLDHITLLMDGFVVRRGEIDDIGVAAVP